MSTDLSDDQLRLISERLRCFAAAVTDEKPGEVGVASAADAIDELIEVRAFIEKAADALAVGEKTLEEAERAGYDRAMAEAKAVESAEIARLHAVIERDRTAVATGAQAITTAISSYRWLTNSRGSYEWDDDRWMKEFSDAVAAIEKALDPLRRITVDTSDCPANWADVVAAREGRN